MKKMFKLTLFKKTFLIIFIGLLCIEGVHVYLDVKYESNRIVERVISSCDHITTKLTELQNTYYNKSLTEDEAKSLLYETFRNETGYFSIISNISSQSNEPLYEFSTPYFNPADCSKITLDSQWKSLDISDFSDEELKIIDDYIVDNKQFIEVYYQSVSNTNGRDKATYLAIDDQIILGELRNDKQLLEDKIAIYSSNNIFYWYDTFGNKVLQLVKKEEYFGELRKVSSELYNEYGTLGVTLRGIKRVDDDIYISQKSRIHIGPHKYFLNYTEICRGVLSSVLYNCLTSKKAAYTTAVVFSFAMSLLISYMVTYRIKRLHKASMLIGHRFFDVKVKDNSKDEIGDLARKMNEMRDRLGSTIEQLNKEIEKVKELESLRKDFINQFTHEMKTPLGIINGYSELLEETENEEERQRYLDIINKETVRINDLVQGMLRLSRLEAGKVELNKEVLDLEDIVTEVIDEFEVLLMKKNIRIEVNVDDKYIAGDKQQIITVLRNFISNAIKHTDTKIVVTVDKGVRVYNEGQPIEQDKLEGIWYTFVTHDKTGTGLGLAICRSILELHNYNYGVTNKDNGVEFYFSI